jgi:hypothetical protein
MSLLWVLVAVEAGAAVAGAEVVNEKHELSLGGLSQTWGWQTRRVNWMVCWRA